MPSVLLIDDNQGTRDTSALLLQLEKINCVTAADGSAGVKAAETRAFDLILVDLHLPDCSGVDVIRQLKMMHISCPAVIVTAFPSLESCFDAAVARADGYIDGPLLAEEFIAMVRDALAGRLPMRRPPRPSSARPRRLPTLGSNNRHDHRIHAAIEAIEDDPTTSLTVLATRLNLSASRLRHLFTAALGSSPSAFRQARRIERAAVLLRNTRRRSSEIAYEVGLQPPSFVKAFQRRFGMTPSQYRARHGAAVVSSAAKTDKK